MLHEHETVYYVGLPFAAKNDVFDFTIDPNGGTVCEKTGYCSYGQQKKHCASSRCALHKHCHCERSHCHCFSCSYIINGICFKCRDWTCRDCFSLMTMKDDVLYCSKCNPNEYYLELYTKHYFGKEARNKFMLVENKNLWTEASLVVDSDDFNIISLSESAINDLINWIIENPNYNLVIVKNNCEGNEHIDDKEQDEIQNKISNFYNKFDLKKPDYAFFAFKTIIISSPF